MNSSKLLSLVSIGFVLGLPLCGQVVVLTDQVVYGWINPFEPLLQDTLKATVSLEFIDTGGDASKVDTAKITVTNFDTSNASYTTTSELTAFYLLKPTEAGLRIDPTTVGFVELPSAPGDWTVEDELGEYVKGYGGLDNSQLDNYFGASSPSGVGLDDGASSATFYINFGDFTFDAASYYDVGNPTVLIRWQNVGLIGLEEPYLQYDWTGGQSGKGGQGPGWDPAIPEPSEVAFLSILGLGAVLWGRKRFMKKAK